MKPSKITKKWAENIIRGDRNIKLSYGDISSRNFESTSSFAFDSFSSGIKNTQQLNVDWSDFASHTFFNSAEAKVNVAFDKIIQEYPFDGSQSEIESFFETLTGFEKYVFDSFPVYSGSLNFSASFALGNSTSSYISTPDVAGGTYTSLTKFDTGLSKLDPGDDSFTVEAHIFPSSVNLSAPVGASRCAWIMNKLDTSSNVGWAIYADHASSSVSQTTIFIVNSGSTYLTSSISLPYDAWSNVSFVFQRDVNFDVSCKTYLSGVLVGTTPVTKIGRISGTSNFNICTGSQHKIFSGSLVTGTFYNWSGSLDELRYYHSARSDNQISYYSNRAVTRTPDLKLYYKFNEPPPPLTTNTSDSINSIVIDYSGNGFHGSVGNFSITKSRVSASLCMYAEQRIFSPVLFPMYPTISALNADMLLSASQYDIENPNLITKLIPPHYFWEANSEFGSTPDSNGDLGVAYSASGNKGIREGKKGSAALLLTFLYTYAKFFDEMKLYIDAFSTVHSVDYDNLNTVPDAFLYDLFKKYGFSYAPTFADASIEQYIDGENISLDSYSKGRATLKSIQTSLMRRLLVSMPEIIKSKGTQHSIRSFLRSVGIDPENSVRIRETGGPTEKVLGTGREYKTTISYAVSFTTSSYLYSPYLSYSGGRTEVGFPTILSSGTFVEKERYHPHGLCLDPYDGYDNVDGQQAGAAFVTSGSWAYEADYRFTQYATRSSTSQSLCRIEVVGTGNGAYDTEKVHALMNLVAFSGSTPSSCSVTLGIAPYINGTIEPHLRTVSGSINVNIFDGDWWRISVSRLRDDDPIRTTPVVSSSYFLRIAKRDALGNIAESYVQELLMCDHQRDTLGADLLNYFERIDGTEYISQYAPRICVGSSSCSTSVFEYDNPGTILKTKYFEGDIHSLKFYSKYVDDVEWAEHIKNPYSAGASDPSKGWNYERAQSGSFGRLRLDAITHEDSTSVGTGNLYFYDRSENGFHLTGSGFSVLSSSVQPVIINHSFLSPYIDEAVTNEKVRIRSFQNQDDVDATPYATLAPLYEILRSEKPVDDTRFSIDFSLIDALNRDIIKIFGSYDYMQNSIGAPEVQYSSDYPSLSRLSDEYFNRIKSDLNFKAFFEFYRWFDKSISSFIEQLVPRKTRFKGTNFLIESHILERGKVQYYDANIYLKDSDKNKPNIVDILE